MLLQRNIYAFTAQYPCFCIVKAPLSHSDSISFTVLFHFSA